jgi:hypothetical protein
LPKIAPCVKHIKLVKPIYKDANAVFSGLDKFDLCLLGVQFSSLGREKEKRERKGYSVVLSSFFLKDFSDRFSIKTPTKTNQT